MHARAALTLVVLAACGRIGFGETGTATSDAPIDLALSSTHDEDADGRPDALDLCPHVPDDNADGDGDRVGDACDPNPTTPTETLTLFSTLQPGDHPFTSVGDFAQEPDALRFTGLTTGLYLEHPIANARIHLGFQIHALVGTGQHQIASGIEGAPYYFVELNENEGGTVRTAAIIEYASTSGYTFLGTANHPGMHPGVGWLRYDADADNRQFALQTGWIAELYDTEAAVPGYVGGTEVRFTVNGLDVSLLHLAVITTP